MRAEITQIVKITGIGYRPSYKLLQQGNIEIRSPGLFYTIITAKSIAGDSLCFKNIFWHN